MTTRALIFDCFGVLCVGTRSFIMSVCPKPHQQHLDDLFRQADYGFISAREFRQQATALLGMSEEKFIALHQQHLHRDERMIELLQHLRSQYLIGLLTNANDAIIRQLFTEHELQQLFSDVLISSEVGIVKPQRELFELAATRLGVQPEACVMIDDSSENIDGARAAGMNGVVFNDVDQCQQALQEFGVYA